MHACCSPNRGDDPRPFEQQESALPAADAGCGDLAAAAGMVLVRAGSFLMGNDSSNAFPGDGEGPVRSVFVSDFLIDSTAVSNADFAAFIESTGYRTEAEQFGWSFVFAGMLDSADRARVMDGSVPGAPWWLGVQGASWRHPFGPSSDLEGRSDHPVVHVSWNDAAEYARWAGKRLPTEAEWEKACRGGREQAVFPWGDELEPGGEHRMNVWQGEFPEHNLAADGYLATAPVNAFAPNGFGLYNTTGNVWEWVADHFSNRWHVPDSPETRRDPLGPPDGPTRVLRGGSHLCHDSYCNRYRTAGRTSNTADSSTGHMGFRCARTP